MMYTSFYTPTTKIVCDINSNSIKLQVILEQYLQQMREELIANRCKNKCKNEDKYVYKHNSSNDKYSFTNLFSYEN